MRRVNVCLVERSRGVNVHHFNELGDGRMLSGEAGDLTSSSFHSGAEVSPLLLQLGQMVPDLLLLLHQLFLLALQPLGVGLHAVLAVLALLCICKMNSVR